MGRGRVQHSTLANMPRSNRQARGAPELNLWSSRRPATHDDYLLCGGRSVLRTAHVPCPSSTAASSPRSRRNIRRHSLVAQNEKAAGLRPRRLLLSAIVRLSVNRRRTLTPIGFQRWPHTRWVFRWWFKELGGVRRGQPSAPIGGQTERRITLIMKWFQRFRVLVVRGCSTQCRTFCCSDRPAWRGRLRFGDRNDPTTGGDLGDLCNVHNSKPTKRHRRRGILRSRWCAAPLTSGRALIGMMRALHRHRPNQFHDWNFDRATCVFLARWSRGDAALRVVTDARISRLRHGSGRAHWVAHRHCVQRRNRRQRARQGSGRWPWYRALAWRSCNRQVPARGVRPPGKAHSSACPCCF